MKNIIYLFICLIIFACSPKNKEQIASLIPPSDCNRFNEFTLDFRDSLAIEVPKQSFPAYENNQVVGDKYLVCHKRNSYKIEIFDIIDKTHLQTITLDPNLVGNIGSFYVHNLDSIFFAKEPFEVLLIDRNGQIIQKWQLDNAPINWSLTGKENTNNIPLYYFPNIIQSILSYDNINHRLFVNLTNIDIWYFGNRQDFKLHGVFDLVDNNWNLLYGHLPNIYASKGAQEIMYPFHLSQPFCLIKGDTSIISFPLDHYLYVYNNKTGKLLSSHCANGSDNQAIGVPLKYDVDMQEQVNFTITSPHYGKLNYHQKIKLYSRIYSYGEILRNNDGTIKKTSDKRLAVIFLDENFKIVGEYLFDKDAAYERLGGTAKNDAIALSDGFLATKKKQYIYTDDILSCATYLQIKKQNIEK